MMRDLICKYLSLSTIHGLVYIATEKKIALKIAWAFIVIFGYALTCFVFLRTWELWQNKPLITTIESMDR